MVVSSASPSILHELFSPYEPVCEIGAPPRPLYVVRRATPGGKPKLFVAERFAGWAKSGDGQGPGFVGEARRISTLASPNVARVRELIVRGDDLIVFWDFIAGEKVVHTWLSSGMPLEVALRLILDVLAGVGAIHGLRDAKQQPMHLAHGEVSTATVVLGLDGVARVLHTIARRLPGARTEDASLAYVAPELHAGGPYDARADVFSVGVLLWEALAGQRLFSNTEGPSAPSQRSQDVDPATIMARVRGGIAPAIVSDKSAWARPLVAVAAKALAASPDDRWQTAAAMAGEIRRVAGLKLAPAAAATAFAKSAMGKRVEAQLERFESGAPALPDGGRVLPTGIPSPDARRLSHADEPLAPAPIFSPAQVPPVNTEADLELVPETLPPPAPSPPPLPARALPPSSSASYLSAAIDVPISIAPPAVDQFEVSPTSVERADAVLEARASHRRIAAVLGSVGMLGAIVFALAGWRVAHRHAEVASSGVDPWAAAPVATSRPTPLPALARAASDRGDAAAGAPDVPSPGFDHAPAGAADVPSPGFDHAAAGAADVPSGLDHAAAGAVDVPSPTRANVATVSVPMAPSRSPRTPLPASAAAKPKPPAVALPTPRRPTTSPPRTKHAPNSNFDPNSL
jgi:hypothetical protein